MKKFISFALLFVLLGGQSVFGMGGNSRKKRKIEIPSKIEKLPKRLLSHDVFLIILDFLSLKESLELCLVNKNLNKLVQYYYSHPDPESKKITRIGEKTIEQAIQDFFIYEKMVQFLKENRQNIGIDFSGNYIYKHLQHDHEEKFSSITTLILIKISDIIFKCCHKKTILELSFGKCNFLKKNLSSILSLPKLQILTLKGFLIQNNIKIENNNFTHNHSSYQRSPLTYENLAPLKNLKNLTQLTLDRIVYDNKKNGFFYLSDLTNLQILYISIQESSSPINLKPLSNLINLKKLTLIYREEERNSLLENFILQTPEPSIKNDNELFYLPKNLQILKIFLNGITDNGISGFIIYLENIHTLGLKGKNITDKSIIMLFDMPKLKKLTLKYCKVNNNTIEKLEKKGILVKNKPRDRDVIIHLDEYENTTRNIIEIINNFDLHHLV